jgi:hypothetical protein
LLNTPSQDTRPVDSKTPPKIDPKKKQPSRDRLSGFQDDSLEASLVCAAVSDCVARHLFVLTRLRFAQITAEEEAAEVLETMIDFNELIFTVCCSCLAGCARI